MEDIIWILVPLAPFMIGAFAIWSNHQQKMMEKQSALTAEKAAQYASQNAQLEQRVRVLERIITDRGFDLAHQIESLRDAPLLEKQDDSIIQRRAN